MKGLKARGGFVVDIEWKHGKLSHAVIHSLAGKPCTVRHKDELKKLEIKQGKSVRVVF